MKKRFNREGAKGAKKPKTKGRFYKKFFAIFAPSRFKQGL